MEQELPPPQGDRHVLELHALRQRQLRTAFLHGRRRPWRDRHRVWPAVLIALVLVALLIAGVSVIDAFHRQQELNSAGAGGNSWTRGSIFAGQVIGIWVDPCSRSADARVLTNAGSVACRQMICLIPKQERPRSVTMANPQHDNHDEQPTAGPTASKWPAKKLETSRPHQAINRLVGRLARFGIVPHTYQLTTIGRKTARLHSNPVCLVEHGDQRWLVAPYGPVPWVLNARAAGRVTLERRRRTVDYAVTELSTADAGPILRDYVSFAGATRDYFIANKDSPVEDFIAEADRHPVFALTRITN